MERRKDEFSDTPVTCPKCGTTATSVYKTGTKVFYNHGEAKVVHKAGQEVELRWTSCEADREPAK